MRIENIFRRLETYIEVPLTAGLTVLIVEIIAEVLCVLAIATKEVKQKRASELTHCDKSAFLFTVMFCSNISEEAGGKEGHGTCAGKTRNYDAGGKSNDRS